MANNIDPNQYPAGKLNDSDEGRFELNVGISADNPQRVLIDFGRPVHWVGMTGDEAIGLAQLLVKHALAAGISKPFSFEL